MILFSNIHPSGDLWEGYWDILTDPSHFLAELTFTFFDVIILSPVFFLIWRTFTSYVKGRIAHEHAILDAEHSVEHVPHVCPTCGKNGDDSIFC